MRRVGIIFFSFIGSYVFYVWMKARRNVGRQSQQRDYEQTKGLIYIDKQAMRDMNLSFKELEEMAS